MANQGVGPTSYEPTVCRGKTEGAPEGQERTQMASPNS